MAPTDAELETLLTATAMVRLVVAGDYDGYRAMVEGFERHPLELVSACALVAADLAILAAEATGVDPIAALAETAQRIITRQQERTV